MTDWGMQAQLAQPTIFDGRNLYDPVVLAEQGWCYYAIGRGASCAVPEAEFAPAGRVATG